jgi:long-chain acyl-CoA synthetase
MAITTTADLVLKHSAERGDSPAIWFEGTTTTWAELDERSNQVANGLIALGVGPQDRVAFFDKNVPEFFELMFGAAKANAVIVGVNWRLAPREVAFIVNDAAAKVLLVGPDFVSVVEAVADQMPTLVQTLVVGEGGSLTPYHQWRDSQSKTAVQLPSDPHDVTLQMYSSGTTGMPKGVMLTNDNLFGAMEVFSAMMKLSSQCVSMVAMPLFHIGGTGWAIGGMFVGAPMHLLREVNPMAVLDTMVTGEVTHCFIVPAVLQFMLMVPDVGSRDFSKLRCIAYGASPISVEVLKGSIATFKCDFMQVYGLTETTGVVTALWPEDHDVDGPNSHRLRAAGRAIPGVECKIVDNDTGETAATGEVGEIYIRSRQVMKGYWNLPEETAKSVLPDGFFRTGDAGYMDADGYVFIHDRVKDMIVSGGENIYPAEVENVLMAHPAIADVAVIGVPSDKWGETPKAMVVLAAGVEPSDGFADEVIAYSREHLARFKCPTSVDVITAIPRNPSGKVLKKDLRAPFWEGRTRLVN